ncbi:MAG: hypothetical protein WC627_13180, partial [Legionella sp.]
VAVKDKHHYNSASLLKKYHYLDILAQYIQIRRLENQEDIATQKVKDLPINLHNRILKFSEVPKIQVAGTTAHPVDTYLTIKEILDSPKEVLTPYEQSLIKPIEEKFPDFKNIYFQNKNTPHTNSDADTNTLLLIAALAEIHDLAHIEQYHQFAQKLTKLFDSYVYVLDYFKKHARTDSKQPIHDLCLFELPKKSLSNREYWIELALQFGPEATQYLANAEKINPFLQQDEYSLQQLGLSSELNRVARIAANISYSRSKEHPQLAALCLRFTASSEAFDKSLNIIQKRLKSFDYLPDITIFGADIDSKLGQYTFSKLPVGDLDGFFLGEYTSCCQSMGKQAETSVIHGMTSPYSGFYVVRRANKIIAQSWVWIADNGDVVFDSWEFINQHEGHIYKPFILKAAEHFLQYGFRRVLIGIGGKTPNMGLSTTECPAQFPPYNQVYSDAKNQFLIADNSACSPYKEFANRHSAYASWIQEGLDNDTILDKISEQIVSHHLSFDNFINLIRFFHLYQQKILFHTGAAHKTLFTNALAAYGRLMNPLYTLIIKDDNTLLDILTSYDDYTLVDSILHQANDFESSIKHLMHCAIRNDASKILGFLYSIHPQAEDANALAAISSQNAPSLLFAAVEHNAQACACFIISKITDEQLITLMQQTNQGNESIMHYLAKNNAVAIYDKIIKKVDISTQLRPFIIAEYFNIIQKALKYNSIDFCRAFTRTLDFTSISKTFIWTALDKYPRTCGLEAFTWIQEQFINKYEWLNYLQLEKSSETIMHGVLNKGYFSLALHLLKDFKDTNDCEYIHPLLLGKGAAYSPIGALKYCPVNEPQELQMFFTKILQIYDHHPDKLIELLSENNYAAFQAIFASQNFELFETLLNNLCHKTTNYSPFYNTRKKTDTILNALLTSNDSDSYMPRNIPLNALKKFIDILFRYCTKADKENLILQLDYNVITGDVLEHLLARINAKNNPAFLDRWTRLDEESPLHTILRQQNNHDIKFYQIFFEYVTTQHTKRGIQTFLLNQWNELSTEKIIYSNPFLFCMIYSLFEKQEDAVARLLKEKLQFDFNNSFYLYSNYQLYIYECTKKSPKTQQNNMSVLLWSMLLQMMIAYNTEGNMLLSKIIMNVLNPMIQAIQINNSDALSVFKLEHPSDLAILNFYLQQDQLDAEGVAHAIKLILINCTQEQRLELIKTYHEKLSGRYKDAIMTELETYVASLERLNILMDLKSERALVVEPKKTASFFPNASDKRSELGALLEPIDANNVVYVDHKYQWLYITTKEINNAWDKVLEILSAKAQTTNAAPHQSLEIILKYQQKMLDLDNRDAEKRSGRTTAIGL